MCLEIFPLIMLQGQKVDSEVSGVVSRWPIWYASLTLCPTIINILLFFLLSYIKQIVQDMGCKSYAEMKELALRREEWRAVSNQS